MTAGRFWAFLDLRFGPSPDGVALCRLYRLAWSRFIERGENQIMPLEFRGLASMDPPKRGVRFAGYPKSSRHPPMIICEVSTEALRLLGEMPDASSDELMGVF